ncbi:MAG: 16S rRNA (uracil(1498)-N(3))-methyltransferase [Pirellulales bacterium]|nr:16S rRNA (uracil(1498)-N(3))-methyltransferase [Pirellulales bacterium]
MVDRYYSETPICGAKARLSGSEAHHLLHVMRAKPGTQLVVFDGHGGEYEAEVAECGRTEVELHVGSRHDSERELLYPLTLAVAIPKGDRQRWLIEKSVELGVSRLIPLRTARSGVAQQLSDKLGRYVIAASKQCGRNRLMEIGPPTEWSALVSGPREGRRLLAHPGGQSRLELKLQVAAETCIAIGPEGGFTENEVELGVDAGWKTINLGDTILRTETAAIVLAGAIVLGADAG